MTINDKLIQLYQNKWNGLKETLKDKGLDEWSNYPLLIGIKDLQDFENADARVMIFGQEMSEGDWYKYDINADLSECVKAIRTFDNKIGSTNVDGKKVYRPKMSWGINKFIDLLNDKYDIKEIRYVWNNLYKMGRNVSKRKDENSRKIIGIEQEYFNVIRHEVEIIKPQVMLFLTGHGFDNILKQRFQIDNLKFHEVDNFPLKKLAKIDLSQDFPSVKYAFRTYHPCAWECKIGIKHVEIYKHIVSQIQF